MLGRNPKGKYWKKVYYKVSQKNEYDNEYEQTYIYFQFGFIK